MASIHKLKDSGGKRVVYRVKWRENGRQTSYTALTPREANRVKALVEAHGTFTDEMARPDVPTVAQWCDRYLEQATRPSADTVEGYRRMLARHVTPALGELAITAVTPEVARHWVNGLRMADKTRHNVVSLFSGVLRTAVEDGYLTRNPLSSIRLPRTDPPTDFRLLTPDQLRVLVSEIPEKYRPLVVTLAGTGMRWGEAAALNVGDVDLAAGVARVTKAVKHRARQDDAPGLPKTRRSVRQVALPPQVAAVLGPLTLRPADAPLFTNSVGKRVRRSTFHGSVWSPALDRAQDPARHGDLALPHRPRIHDLRAFATTWMIDHGIQIDLVADQLGHQSISTTFNVYRRINPEAARRVAAAMGEVLGRLDQPQVVAEPERLAVDP